jgi:hypothetical protein
VPLADEPAIERQHLADQSAGLVAVVKDEGVDAGVNPEQLAKITALELSALGSSQ